MAIADGISGPVGAGEVVVVRYWGSHIKTRRQARDVARESRGLIARGWRCHLILSRLPDDEASRREFESSGIRLHAMPRPRRHFDFPFALRLRRLLRSLSADVFHCENLHTSPLLGAALAGVPARLWTKRAMNATFEECRPPTFKERIALSTRVSSLAATRIIAVSKAVKRELIDLGIAPEKVLVRHNAVELKPATEIVSREKIRASWGCRPDEVVAITVGRAVPVKGWDLLAEAFVQIAATAPNLRLVFVGSISNDEEQTTFQQVRMILQKAGVLARATFSGHLEDVQSCLHAADIFVMSSRSEGFSHALVESLQAGLPTIASRVGVADDVIMTGENGFLVERNDATALAQALLPVAQDETLRARLAKRAMGPSCIPTLAQFSEQLARDYELLLAGDSPAESLERVFV